MRDGSGVGLIHHEDTKGTKGHEEEEEEEEEQGKTGGREEEQEGGNIEHGTSNIEHRRKRNVQRSKDNGQRSTGDEKTTGVAAVALVGEGVRSVLGIE